MRLFVLAVIASLGLAAPAAWAQDAGRPEPGRNQSRPASKPDASRAVTLDSLFDRLAKAENEREAEGISNLIERRWARSGSDTADLLLSRASEAAEKKNLDLAVELLDRVVTLQPGWASAWYTRATVFYQLDDPVGAMADLHRALTIEPRHYAAWAGLGQIFMASDDKGRALEAFRRALKINPQIPNLQPIVEKLGQEIDGQDL
ncbi:tetratricopeptide repeat protein [Microvirga brassicacearum]|uniref:Tetratricopeptide repeat protein n=1 Tax=Microvirga brassicacearum TaxID=2580413 RepID=A0A5N3PGS3_9HYPH|nr:tetratricopeptide repeat protein [Microvirga brassicacearum]KAB0268931.1 tetratricopeptide repeat protein [Microvirga brassicacearum]